MRLQVRGDGLDEGIRRRGRRRSRRRRRRPRAAKASISAGRHRPAVVGARARQRRRGLDDVEAVGALGLAPPRREVADVARHGRARAEEVGLERHDRRRPCRRRTAARPSSPNASRAPAGTLSRPTGSHATHFAAGKAARTSPICFCERRRGDRPRQEPEPRAAVRALLLERRACAAARNALHGRISPALGQRLRAVRVVDVEDRGLREDVRAAEARRVQLVALDLDRPALVALGEDAARVAAVEVRGRVEERLAGDELLGRLDVREDPLGRLPRAARQPRERDGGAHQRQQLAPVHARVDRHPELAVQVLAEILGLEQLLEAAPVLAPLEARRASSGRCLDASNRSARSTHRWHVVQSVSSNVGRMWYSAFSRSPISSWIPAGT